MQDISRVHFECRNESLIWIPRALLICVIPKSVEWEKDGDCFEIYLECYVKLILFGMRIIRFLLSISHKIWCEFDSAYFWRFVSSLVIDFRSGDIFMAAHNIASKWNSFSLCPNQDIPCHSISTLHPPSFSLPLHLHRWDDNSVNVWHTAKARPISNMSINWNKIILKFERLPTRNMKSRLKVNSKYPKKTQIFG